MAYKSSGLHLEAADIPIVLGMVARDDRDHDIAAWFGVNQGRIAEAKKGKWGSPAIAGDLPPRGAPGIKGRRLRETVQHALTLLSKGDAAGAAKALGDGAARYDQNEI